mmetsp:Transcript_57371/g.167962  ORF Transcript_57371/g.167962 Transcript_57371/m.167962 type:complete len:580 (-) Transcript_57371:75-1814(-)
MQARDLSVPLPPVKGDIGLVMRGDSSSLELDLRSPLSLEELLRDQVAAAQRVLACAGEIHRRLGEAPEPAAALPLAAKGGRADGGWADLGKSWCRPRTLSGNGPSLAEPLLRTEPSGLPPSPSGGGRSRPRLRKGERGLVNDDSATMVSTSSYEGEVPSPKRRSSRRNTGEIKRNSVFPDPEELKTQVRLTMNQGSYNVESLYHTAGLWQYLARNNKFKNLTFVIIALNAMWIGVDTDCNKQDILTNSPWEFQVVEHFFCSFFAFEIFVRYKAFRNKRDALNDGWFVFDSFLVAIMVWATWLTPLLVLVCRTSAALNSVIMQNTSIFRVMRLFRMARVARLARLLRDMPELMILVKGMVSAMRAVFSTLCLLVLIIYIFAIVFTQTLSGTKAAEGCFENVLQSMNCLLLNGIFADQADIINNLLSVHWTYYLLILVYMVIGSLTVLNMLIGVMCEVVGMVSAAEKDALRAQNLKDTIGKALKGVDADDDHCISHHEFRALLHMPEAMFALQEVNIDVIQLVDFAEIIFQDKESIAFGAFIDTILQFRNDNTATVKDLVDCRRLLVTEISAAVAEHLEEE